MICPRCEAWTAPGPSVTFCPRCGRPFWRSIASLLAQCLRNATPDKAVPYCDVQEVKKALAIYDQAVREEQ